MCGIAGFYTRGEPLPASLLEDMTTALAHRGPDDAGYFGGGVLWKKSPSPASFRMGLGFRRLSILDLSSQGSQPMQSQDGRWTLIFNGQIYNYIELKAEMTGEHFRSRSDTEVLLKFLEKNGVGALHRLDGMFAFALYDAETRELHLSRDPLGIKPLYYFVDDRGIFFGSELRALWKARKEKPRLNVPLVSRYFMNHWVPDPDTLFEGIRKVEPGHTLTVTADGEIRSHKHWELQFDPDEQPPLEEWIERLDAALEESVRRQMRSDVPVGFFLSGGVDSSLLTAKAVALKQDRPTTFTIGFDWDGRAAENQDILAARKIRDRFPIEYREILLRPSIVSELPRVVDILEEPIADPAALCSLLICEAAKGDFKVLISGQGGDEIFGGYPVYQAGRLAAGLSAMPSGVRRLISHATQGLPYAVRGRPVQTVHRLQKIIASQRAPWPDSFLLLRSPLRTEEMGQLLNADVQAVQKPPFGRHHELFSRMGNWDYFHQMMALDTKTYLPNLNLAYSDKTSMHHSIELRVPLLDRVIVDLAQRMPSREKLDMFGSKIVLKKVAEKYLPRDVVYRRKAGFGLPLRDWFLKDLQPMAQELLAETRLRRQGLLNPELPTQWLKEHREKKADHCMKLYSLMTFQLWCDKYEL